MHLGGLDDLCLPNMICHCTVMKIIRVMESLFFGSLFYFMSLACMFVCAPWASLVPGDQKRALGLLELDLQKVVDCLVEAKN